MAKLESFEEENVTKNNLENLFSEAYMSTSMDGGGGLVVEAGQIRVLVDIMKESSLIKYVSYFGIDKSKPLEAGYKLVNQMNRQIVFCRFSIVEDALVSDYFLPYEKGVSKFQIISSIRFFGKVVPSAIQSCDDIGLVE